MPPTLHGSSTLLVSTPGRVDSSPHLASTAATSSFSNNSTATIEWWIYVVAVLSCLALVGGVGFVVWIVRARDAVGVSAASVDPAPERVDDDEAPAEEEPDAGVAVLGSSEYGKASPLAPLQQPWTSVYTSMPTREIEYETTLSALL